MRNFSIAAMMLFAGSTCLAADNVPVDLSAFKTGEGITIVHDDRLRIAWPIAEKEYGVIVLRLQPNEPLIEHVTVVRGNESKSISILQNVNPETLLTVGVRDLSKQGWNAFFDNPPTRPHETFRAVLELKKVRVESHGKRCTIIFDKLTAGPFQGDLRFTVYPGCRLVHVESVLSTDKDACAILYDTGLVAAQPAWQSLAWLDTNDRLQRVKANANDPAAPIAVRRRTLVAEGANGSVAIFPPPHQYLYPLDFAENFKFVWHGHDYQKKLDGWGFGVRQPPEGDKRFVPWINAPPGTQQRLGVLYLLSLGKAEKALEEAALFTRGDRFKPLDGYRTFSSHYHIEHTLEFVREQKAQKTDGIPKGLEQPSFVKAFKAHGIDIVHLAEFHTNHTPEMNAERLPLLKTLHDECRRLSDDKFLLLPGEEPNVQLGGHWISFFPKPVYWLLHPGPDVPFERKVDGLGTVYAVKSPDDVLKLMEKEKGLMWTAHARTKSSYGFPDKYRDTPFYKSDRFLGAAWKAMPADLSQPRLGLRVLDLFNDMNDWGQRKQVIGEVDVFKVKPDYELYGPLNINYVKLAKLPRFEDGWQPLLDALRAGQFFVTTGEVLLTKFKVGGKESGETLKLGQETMIDSEATLEWTFPPSFAELIWSDGKTVQRQRIDLGDQPAFASKSLRVKADLKGAKWARLEAWDIAANGAFSQSVWVE